MKMFYFCDKWTVTLNRGVLLLRLYYVCSLFAIPFGADSIQDERASVGIQDGRRKREERNLSSAQGAILSDCQSKLCLSWHVWMNKGGWEGKSKG